jgi:hypothetical protein
MALKATPPRNTRSKSNDAITSDDVTRLNAEKLQRQKDAKAESRVLTLLVFSSNAPCQSALFESLSITGFQRSQGLTFCV